MMTAFRILPTWDLIRKNLSIPSHRTSGEFSPHENVLNDIDNSKSTKIQERAGFFTVLILLAPGTSFCKYCAN
jgi:hypothetical protein